jgi:hypothetical protein
MDCLAREDNLRGVRRALQDLPKDLEETYYHLMERIQFQDRHKAKRAEQLLAWIASTTRPLTVKELQSAIAVAPNDENPDKEALPDMNTLVSTCAGIVTVDQGSQLVRFVHYTFQDYMAVHMCYTMLGDPQMYVTQACMIYLSLKIFGSGYCTSDRDMSAKLSEYPFLRYASGCWGLHARGQSEHDSGLQKLVCGFLGRTQNVISSVQAMQVSQQQYEGYSQIEPKEVHGLWLAARFGLQEICKLLLAGGCDVNQTTSEAATALHEAARRGH